MIQILIILIEAIVISLVSAFAILLMQKIGIREYLVVHAPKLISKAMECDFCTCWWVNLAISLLSWGVTGQWVIMACAVIATPITRALIR